MMFDNRKDDVIRDENNVISVSTKYDRLTERGLGYAFFEAMQKNKDKVAQFIADSGVVDTYGDLLERVIRTALHLKERDLNSEDVVCLCSYNQLNNCVPFLACIFLGIQVASIDPSFTVNEGAHLIKLVRPKICFIVPEVTDVITESLEIAEINTEIVVYGDDVDNNKYTSFDMFLKKHQDEDSFTPTVIEDISQTAVIFFSSGTTGMPKGVCNSHKAVYHQACIFQHMDIIGPDSVALLYSTLYWVSAVLHLTTCVMSGAARLVCKNFDPIEAWHLIAKYKVTMAFLAPIQGYSLISAGRPDDIDTSSMYCVITGGALFSTEKLHELRDLLPGTFISQAYGCTEVSGLALSFNVSRTKDRLLMHYKPASCGRAVLGSQYKIVDLETENNCGPNERGELRIKSEFLLNGYYRQDSSGAFDADGWLRTGDVMYYDDDLCFYVVDRIKEMLKFRSWHVPPAILEGVKMCFNILQTHPSVKQSVVIGIPHETDGDHPMAVISLKEKFIGNVTSEEIQEFIAERVNDTHRLRGGVRFIDVMPVTPSGKVKRMQIREMVLKGLL